MQDYERDNMDYMQPMGMPNTMQQPIMGMPNQMYPMANMGMPNQMYQPMMGMPEQMYPMANMGMPNQMYPMADMGIPNQMYPMAAIPEQELEKMYPKVYNAVYPEVIRRCDSLDATKGNMHIPTPDEVKKMIDDIYVKVEVDVNVAIKQDSREGEDRQLGVGGRGLLRGLIGILLIRDLIRRRRRPFFGFPYGPGFGYY